MNNKKLDGIKKISKTKLERSKEIVLNVIDEKIEEKKEIKKPKPRPPKKKEAVINIKDLYKKNIKENKKINIKLDIALLKRSIILVTISALIVINFYLIFIFSVLKFDLDNGLTRYINKYFPVPAVISEEGIINYYNFKDSEKDIRKIFKQENKYKLFLL